MQTTIASRNGNKAPHELSMNRTVTNSARATAGAGFSNGDSNRRVRSRDDQTSLADHSGYGLLESGASHMLARDANQQLYLDLNYAAYTYGQSLSTPRSGIHWPFNQLAYSDGVNGAGYGYNRDPRSVNLSSRNQQSYSDYVDTTYGYEQARKYMYGEDSFYSKYQLSVQEPSLQLRSGSAPTYLAPSLSSGDASVYSYGDGDDYPNPSWNSSSAAAGNNVFTTSFSRGSSVTRPSLYKSQDSAYYDDRDSKIEKSLSPPSSQLFLPDSSDFFLDYTDIGVASDISSLHGSQRAAEPAAPDETDVARSLSNYFNDEVGLAPSSTGPVVERESSKRNSKSASQRERKRLKIDTEQLFAHSETNTSVTTSSPTEPTSATSSNNSSGNQRNGKKFPCSYCTKMFNRPSSRNTHELVHTGEKPHMCTFPTCEKRFSVLSNLRRHLKIHRAPPKGRGRHANNSNISNNNNNTNNSDSEIIIINNTTNSINTNNIGNYIQGPRTSSPHPYGGLGVRDYIL